MKKKNTDNNCGSISKHQLNSQDNGIFQTAKQINAFEDMQ